MRRLSAGEALRRLLPVVSVPWFDRAVVPDMLSTCDGLLAAVPCSELEFTPDAGVVESVREVSGVSVGL